MCLFKKSEFKKATHLNWIIGGTIATVILALFLPLFPLFRPNQDLLPSLQVSSIAISAIALIAVLLTLCIALEQLYKSMAKPLIKVVFNKRGEQQATLIYRDGQLTTDLPSPWLINEGNAVARYFQIDFIIPENIGKQSRYTHIARDDGNYIISHTNDGKYTLFVNQYLDSGTGLSAAIDTKKCVKADEDSFEIKYRIYGDWAETQEGKLKVNINKQQEELDAAGENRGDRGDGAL